MKILMMTNTYLPFVGGVARSVEQFATEYRRAGHRVLIVAPEYEGAAADETDVVRVPAIQHFNGSDFSVRLPVPGYLSASLQEFRPELVHSHHPFLLGDTALRVAAAWNIPLVFTHHTMYEQYTHYVPGESELLKRYVIDLSAGYANLCDCVFAPSESVAEILRQRGVETPIEVVPTGVDVERFGSGQGSKVREEFGIPADAFVVGHVGRLAPEKNLLYLAKAVALFLRRTPRAHLLVVGSGPSADDIRRTLADQRLEGRLHLAESRTGQDLVDALHAMDVFAFASRSETQGMVVTEAMAAGRPVVALDASGIREVVCDRVNGRLLRRPTVRRFAGALRWVAKRSPSQRQALSRAARSTAKEFSMVRCAERALESYGRLVQQEARRKTALGESEDTPWETALRLIEVQWELWTTRARAAGAAIRGRRSWTGLLFGPLARGFRRVRRAVSRSEWSMRLLGLSYSVGTHDRPGLVLVQIDGLARSQFERALRRGRMPFLRRLLARRGYQLHTMYSGQPATTPAVQAELFYGVKRAVPSFRFREHDTGVAVRMFNPWGAAKVQQRLSVQGEGLLRGGSAYGDIYSGGAAESYFCPAEAGWGRLLSAVRWWRALIFLLLYVFTVVRVAVTMVVEFGLALVDFFRGVIAGENLWREIVFISARVGVGVLMRELLTIGARIDAARGLPIIHVNFLAYDEQAHRRGPGSPFAHWSLKGIDRAVRQIWRGARQSGRRNYQVWIYSDHGQEATISYPKRNGRSVEEAVAAVFEAPCVVAEKETDHASGIQHQRAEWLGGDPVQNMLRRRRPPENRDEQLSPGPIVVTAMGPVGHIYPCSTLSFAERCHFAQRLLDEAKIPMVLVADGPGQAVVWTAQGQFGLPEDASAVLGPDHPFLDEVARDLALVCHHPDAGELVIVGWSLQGPPVSFAEEHGAHAGPGIEETRAFLLVPSEVQLPPRKHEYLRPLDLRQAVLEQLDRRVPGGRRGGVPSHCPEAA